MIQIFNPSRLTRQPFFIDLVDYLDQHDEVILREIKAQFPDVAVDKLMEEYIKAGLILRENKRYYLNLPLLESTDFAREKMTLSNYFYKVKNQYPLTEKQQKLYAVLGDVNPEYALKYMTTFLLKFLKKDQLMQKRRDIFVESLVVLGYIVQNEEGKYELAVDFDKERLFFYLS